MDNPVGAIIFVVIFAAVIIICVISDKKKNTAFLKEIEEKYPIKESYDKLYVTEKGELLYYFPSGSWKAYKKWNLQEVAYIATNRGEFSLCDSNRKELCGEYLYPGKKFLKESKYKSFPIGSGKIDGLVDFLKRNAGHIQHMSGGKIVG